MEKERILVCSGAGEVPNLMFCEVFILWCHFEPSIIRKEDLFGGSTPVANLIGSHVQPLSSLRVALRDIRRRTQVVLSHEIGVDVIINKSAILIGAGDAIDTKLAPGVMIAERMP